MNFAAPESGIFDFIMNSAGLVALFVYAFIALTQIRMRQRMTKEEVAGLELKMWLHPWLGILVIAAVIGIVVIMVVSGEGTRTQVWTSLISVAVLAVSLARGAQAARACAGEARRRGAGRSGCGPAASGAGDAASGLDAATIDPAEAPQRRE